MIWILKLIERFYKHLEYKAIYETRSKAQNAVSLYTELGIPSPTHTPLPFTHSLHIQNSISCLNQDTGTYHNLHKQLIFRMEPNSNTSWCPIVVLIVYLLGLVDVRVAVCEKSQLNGFLSDFWYRRFMAYVAWEATVAGSKQAPPGCMGLQSRPCPHT